MGVNVNHTWPAEQVQEGAPPGSLNIFLPTTPNPTSGFLLFIPKKAARKLSMTVEEGLKMVISGGIVTPGGDQAQAADASTAPSDSASSALQRSRRKNGDGRQRAG